MTTASCVGRWLLSGIVAAGVLGSSARGAGPLRGVDKLAQAYDSILDARFDQVEPDLQKACGPAPPEACDVLAATAIWWRIQLDPESRARDAAFSAAVEHAIDASEAWAARTPKDAEAWFYLGGAYAARVQWRVLRNEKLAAARDGKRIKQALEKAIELDPTIEDAYFGVGMYHYYADVAPTAAKILRFLLLLPGGDRKGGLQQMLRARENGRLMRGEADYQLHVVYLWYEQRTDRALAYLRALQQQYPGNPLFPSQIAHIQDTYQHDVTASLASWRALLASARDQRVNAAALAEVEARIGIARQMEALFQTDRAIEQLETVIAAKPAEPYGVLGLAWLRLGEARDRMGDRVAANEAYRNATATAADPDPYGVRAAASTNMKRTRDARLAEAYRLSLEGLRRTERNDFPAAAAALEKSLALNGADPVAHYRYGHVLQARGDESAALVQFEAAIAGARTCPPSILGTAYLDAGRLYERSGRRDRAIQRYMIAQSLFGAAADTHAAASKALTRLSGGSRGTNRVK